MSKDLKKGDKVSWTWGSGHAHGKVAQRFTERVRRTIKGAVVIRNATEDEPAYLITQEDGARVLKSASELSKG